MVNILWVTELILHPHHLSIEMGHGDIAAFTLEEMVPL